MRGVVSCCDVCVCVYVCGFNKSLLAVEDWWLIVFHVTLERTLHCRLLREVNSSSC